MCKAVGFDSSFLLKKSWENSEKNQEDFMNSLSKIEELDYVASQLTLKYNQTLDYHTYELIYEHFRTLLNEEEDLLYA